MKYNASLDTLLLTSLKGLLRESIIEENMRLIEFLGGE